METTFNSLGIDKLRFFTGEGHEIIMQKIFSAKWEIIPNNLIYSAFYKNPSGHFELSPTKDLSYLIDEEHAIWDNDYVISEAAEMTNGYQYDITATAISGQPVVILKDEIGANQGYIISNVSGEINLTIIKKSQTEIQILTDYDVIIPETDPNFIKMFSVRVPHELRDNVSISEISNKCQIIVDDPGIIRPYAKFPRSAHDQDFIASHDLIVSVENICVNNGVDSYYKEIEDDSLTYSVENVYDIIFFGYKTISDGNTYYETNTLRLTLNDGQNEVIQDYNILDFMRSSTETAIEENLKKYDQYENFNDVIIETFDDLINAETTSTTPLYGITSNLICEVQMSEYNQYDEKLLIALEKSIIYARNKSLTDSQILKLILSTFEEQKFTAEYWDNEYIVNIVRSYIEVKTAAKTIIDFTLYGKNIEKTMCKTVARYTIEYNIPEDQYPYVRYYGEVYQEKASANLISSQTIVIVTDNGNNAPIRYTYPEIIEQQSNTVPIQYRLHFKFQNDSEMKFVTMKDDNELQTLDSLYALTPDEINQTETTANRETNALHFAVGFQAEEEGCYNNSLGIFILNTDTEEDNFIGIINFKTEVEGEDYRYRTLFTNFGIPDPVLYPNIFKNKDPEEEGTDWRTVNLKSKELFLTYDQIFPYVGTYRALFNAIKFLGYTDLIFKEWYKIKDANDKYKYVAIQNYDSSTGKSIPNAIKKYGVDYTEQDRYLKLNRLSTVYHLEEINQNASEEELKVNGFVFNIGGQKVWIPEKDKLYRLTLYADKYGSISGNWEGVDIIVALNTQTGSYSPMLVQENTNSETPLPDKNRVILSSSTERNIKTGLESNPLCILTEMGETTLTEPFVVIDNQRYPFKYDYTEIPQVDNIYEYRSDEVLAKLYSVKKWLEDYITGVNCYISDINGERIILERIKTVGYVTNGEVKDITNEGKFTPRCEIKKDENGLPEQFKNSSINLTCSLNEFRSVTFEDYADYPIERFIKYSYNRNVAIGSSEENVTVYVSAPLNALTVADEYQFEVNTGRVDCGSLYEFTDKESDNATKNPIVIQDCEIKFWDDSKTISKISNSQNEKNCPIIQINKGNIRSLTKGKGWNTLTDNNIIWSIYTAKNLNESSENDENVYTFMTKVDEQNSQHTFTFKGCVNLNPVDSSATFTYSTDNKWKLPMITIKGYKPTNQMRSKIDSGEEEPVYDRYVEESDGYIIEIFEGRILFNNNNKTGAECNRAVVTIKEPEQMPPNEQDIFVDYTYESERTPIYTFDADAFNSLCLQQSFSDINDLYRAIDNYVHLNTEIDIPVNRLANYSVTVKAYDAYNNTFVNVSDDKCEVKTRRPEIEIIANQKNSQNEKGFYDKPNINGQLLDSGERSSIRLEKNPKFNISYKLYGATAIDDSKIVYDNISYAIDTPKRDDYIILTNLTEKSSSINNQASAKYIITLDPYNPGKQNIINANRLTVCIYDDEYRNIISQCVDISVSKRYGKIEISKNSLSNEFKEKLELNLNKINDPNSSINFYMINTTRIQLNNDDINIFDYTIIDKDERTTFIPVKREYANIFTENTMIKICISDKNGLFQNEAAYRIIERSYIKIGNTDIYGYKIDGLFSPEWISNVRNRNIYNKAESATINNSEDITYEFNLEKLDFELSPLHLVPVQYMLRVNEDAVEKMYKYSTYFYGSNVEVDYNSKQLLFDSYFDNSYAASISKFEPLDAKHMWRNLEAIVNDDNYKLYSYKNFPITIEKNRYLIIRPSSDITQIVPNYKTLWKWKSYAIEDNSNWKEHIANKKKVLLFELKNKTLSLSPDMLGPQFVELYCMDCYGNIIVNDAGGNIFVDSDEDFSSPSNIKK